MATVPRLNRVTSITDVPVERKVAEMIRVPAVDPICGAVVSDSIFALETHYVHPRTRICTGVRTCEFCNIIPIKWYGLIAVWDRNWTAPKWVQLTSQAAASLLQEVAARQLTLFGLCVRIGRQRKVKNAPIVISIDEYARVGSRLPKPMDPQETIERVFGTKVPPGSTSTKLV